MRIANCKVNRLNSPLGFDLGTTPRVSWTVEDCAGKAQRTARVKVCLDPEMTKTVYDTGDQEDADSRACPLAFSLRPYTKYFWTVSVLADDGECAVSPVNTFETAKMDDPWWAEWIGPGGLDTENPVFVKGIETPCEIKDARIYVCGLGLYEIFLNGEKVGEEYLAPGCHDYNMQLMYQTYRIDLAAGENRLEVSLGNGWYRGRFGYNGAEKCYGDDFSLILEVRKDGGILCTSDDTWKVRRGAVIFNNIYDGEVFDPSAADGVLYPVALKEGRTDLLRARLSLPVVVKETLPVKEVLHTPKGETVLDFGQNFAGFVRMRCRESAGRTVRLRYGEVLKEGCFYRDNLRSAKAEYVYRSDGQERILSPGFTYYGFRYVAVEGLEGEADPADFTGCVLYSDLDGAGSLATDNELVNRLIANAVWSQKSNYVDIPTDCPQRDERMGWTGDTQMFSGTACFNMDSCAFLNKYLTDVALSQEELGHVPHTVPAFDNRSATCAAWGDVATIVPWNLYLFYGDPAILAQQYESMKQWVEYIHAEDEKKGGDRLWHVVFSYGDWLARDHENPEERVSGGTDLDYISSAYYYYSARIVAKAAAVLGKAEDEKRYNELADEVLAAIRREYFTATGRLCVTTQTGYVLALFMGLAPVGTERRLEQDLRHKLRDAGNYLKTGFVGTPYLCRTLSGHHMNSLAYTLLLNEKNPSWLYAVVNGATTIWERWNSMLEDGTVNGTDMTSFNHYAYGSVLEWMYRDMAGLNPVEECPGFRKARIAPKPDPRIGRVDLVYPSASGTYEIHWAFEGTHLSLSLTIPFGASAEVEFPYHLAEDAVLTAGSYSCDFDLASLHTPVDIHTAVEDLMEIPKARKVLDEVYPGWEQVLPAAVEAFSLAEIADSPFGDAVRPLLGEIEERLRLV